MFYKIIGEAKGIFNVVTIVDIIISVISILMGLTFFTNSTMNYIVVAVLSGLVMIGTGISSIYSYLKKSNIDLFNNNIIYGIIFIILGLVMLFIGKYASIIFGIYLIVECAKKVNYGLMLKKYNESSWLLNIVTGILLLVIAIITFFTSVDNLVMVIGINLLGYGLLSLVNLILLRKRSNYFLA